VTAAQNIPPLSVILFSDLLVDADLHLHCGQCSHRALHIPYVGGTVRFCAIGTRLALARGGLDSNSAQALQALVDASPVAANPDGARSIELLFACSHCWSTYRVSSNLQQQALRRSLWDCFCKAHDSYQRIASRLVTISSRGT
jgi:DNA-directed RNA polymerase subunit RPC12/RpoP